MINIKKMSSTLLKVLNVTSDEDLMTSYLSKLAVHSTAPGSWTESEKKSLFSGLRNKLLHKAFYFAIKNNHIDIFDEFIKNHKKHIDFSSLKLLKCALEVQNQSVVSSLAKEQQPLLTDIHIGKEIMQICLNLDSLSMAKLLVSHNLNVDYYLDNLTTELPHNKVGQFILELRTQDFNYDLSQSLQAKPKQKNQKI